MKTADWYKLLIEYGSHALTALIILIVGLIIAKTIRSRLRKYFSSHATDPTAMLFMANAAYGAILIIMFIIILAEIGVPTASLLALLGTSTLAIGLALKDSLSNIAGGLLLIMLKPFRIGDFIEIGNIMGTADQINLFTTRLKTANNDVVYVPNSRIMTDKINNKTQDDNRRIDLTVGIGYNADLKLAKKLITELFSQDERILKDPAPMVVVKELADSAVLLAVRPWVKKGDYGSVLYELLENIKLKFDENKVEIPFPQMDVHIHKTTSD
jgi:small conductance mechanosensitive channel